MFCLGLGGAGVLGDGSSEQHLSGVPMQIPIDAPIETMGLGLTHACARTRDGVTRCWGDNGSGQIGDGTSGPDNERLVPTPAVPWGGGPIATGWTAAALGPSTACGLREGAPWCWGSRAAGALGNDDDVECQVSDPTECSLTTPVEVAGTGVFSTLSVGSSFACALRDDGTLWCWGSNELGQLGNDDEAALVPVQVGAQNDWTDVDVGGGSTCGLRSPGSLWCWGDDEFGELGDGTAGEFSTTPTQVGADADWIDVVVGMHHVCGLRAGGTLACWGHNLHGQLGIGAETEEPMPTPSVVAGTWTSVALGRSHTCAVADDGTAWCWGLNNDGDVDPAGPAIVPAPVQVGVDADWQSLALGESFTCGLRTDGTAWCWGSNYYGQIGNGEVLFDSDAFVDEPTMVADIDDWLTITADNSTACGVRSDATVSCWGQNHYGQQGNDTIFTSGVPREVRDDG
jgi:alpha-tubulin suppressor-like RCC1 family protein